jgi:hypothetical protein
MLQIVSDPTPEQELMMKIRLISINHNAILPGLVLVAVLLSACAPSGTQTQPAPESVILQPTATFPPQVPTLDPSSQPTAGPTQALAPTPLPVATSRGDALEATDPATVSLASGQYQFVEFFRFT